MSRSPAKVVRAKPGRRTPKTAAPERLAPVEMAATPQKILDAAEALFGAHSFDSVSMRDISAAAAVNLGLVHYHFGSKDALFEQVVARRAKLLGGRRVERLRELEKGGALHLEALMDAFMGPMFELMQAGDPGWRSYVLLLAQIGQSNRWLGLLDRYYDPTAGEFMGALGRALPELGLVDRVYGFNFALITMLHTVAQNRRLNALSSGTLDADDLRASYPKLLAFVCGGLRALARPPREAPSERAPAPRPSVRRP